jgi:hypothetical protein
MIWDCKLTQILEEYVASIFIVIERWFHVDFEGMVGGGDKFDHQG